MRKILKVAKHEYLSNVRRKSFVFTTFGIPVLLIALMFVITRLAIQAETGNVSDQVGYVDHSGVLESQNARPENFAQFDTDETAAAALEVGEIGAYFVVAEDYLQTGAVTLYSASGGGSALIDIFNQYLLANLDTGLDPEIVTRVKDPVVMSVLTLDNGRLMTESSAEMLFIIPMIFVMIFFITIQTTSGTLMSSVAEEKSTRVIEILVTSMTPFQLLAGKIIGLGALGLTQIGIWVGATLLFITLGNSIPALQGLSVPTDIVLIGFIYFVLGYALVASFMAGIGAVAGSEQESRQIAGLAVFPLVVPFFFIYTFIVEPNATIAVFLTLFPITAPVTVMLRTGFSSVPAWQIAASVIILAITTLITVWASARVFRWSILMYGKRPSLRRIIGAIFGRAEMQTTATGERAG